MFEDLLFLQSNSSFGSKDLCDVGTFHCGLWEFFQNGLITKYLIPKRLTFPWQYITAIVTAIIFKPVSDG